MPTHDDDLEEVVMLQRLKPDRIDEYDEAHEDVPQSVIDAMERADVADYRLYRRKEIVVGIMWLPSLDRFEEEYGADPENEAWETRVGQFKQEGVDPDEMEMPVMDLVWSLSSERE